MAGRRGNGEGSLYKDSKRKGWVFEQRVTLPDGSTRRIKSRGKSQAAAINRMRVRVQELSRVSDPTITVETFMTGWLAHKKPLVKGATYRGYEQDSRLYIVPMLGPKPLSRVTAWDVQAVIDTITADGRLVMADRVRRTFRQALDHAEMGGLIDRNPAAKVKRVKPPPPNRGSWTREQARAFIEAAHQLGPEWVALFVTAVTTGMRKGELIALRRIDLLGDTLRVARSHTPYGDKLFDAPKSRAGKRRVPILPEVRAMLEAHILRSPDSELLFPSWDGGPLNPRTITTRFDAAITASGAPRIRFHDLRRTYATWMLKDGVDMKVAQRQLGHAGPMLLLEVYADAQGDGVPVGGVSGGDSPIREGDYAIRLEGRQRRKRRRKADQE